MFVRLQVLSGCAFAAFISCREGDCSGCPLRQFISLSAQLRPLSDPGTDSEDIVERWRSIPVVDLVALRSDLDQIPDSVL